MSEADLLKELASLVLAAKPIVEYDATMMASITRHSPFGCVIDKDSFKSFGSPRSYQAKHDSTEYPSEIWLERFKEIEKLLEYYK
jgi:hypothetical protein